MVSSSACGYPRSGLVKYINKEEQAPQAGSAPTLLQPDETGDDYIEDLKFPLLTRVVLKLPQLKPSTYAADLERDIPVMVWQSQGRLEMWWAQAKMVVGRLLNYRQPSPHLASGGGKR